MHQAGAIRSGTSRPPRHHILPREHSAWFEQRGFVGEHDIDQYYIELPVTEHEVIHGGASSKLARKTWPEHEWSTSIMKDLDLAERKAGRKLNRDEVLGVARKLMKKEKIANSPFVTYKNRTRTRLKRDRTKGRTPERRR